MKRFRKGMAAWMLLVALFCCSALAELDLNQLGSIGVRIHTADGVDVPDAKLEIYRVGNVKVENHNLGFELMPAFAGSGVSLNDLNASALALNLLRYAEANSIATYDADVTGEDGRVKFELLPAGAYLVAQDGFASTQYFTEIEPFLVTIPMMRDGEWAFEIDASPKAGTRPRPTPTPVPTKPPTDEKLPQTGLMRWPVLALACGGVLLFSLGWVMFFRGRKRKDA